MPLLASLVATLFGSLFAQLATILGTRLAVGTAAVATVAALTTAFVAAMAALLGTLELTFPLGADIVGTGIYLFVPSVTPVALAAVFTADAACALYRWKVLNVRLVAN